MDTMELDAKKMDVVREILDIDNEKLLAETVEYIRQGKKRVSEQTSITPPEGFMTGDEFERRVKEELKQLYEEHGLLQQRC